jgi:hypothetical protein
MATKQMEGVSRKGHDAVESRSSPQILPCGDSPLDAGHEPPLGAHVVSPRLGYMHHGIYAGAGRVVQYGGLSWGLRPGPVEEVSLSQFAQGRPVWVRVMGSAWFDPLEVVRRARLRLGEDRYSVLTNNCEHFCEWCLRGEPRSYQVERRIAGHRGALLKLVEWLARPRSRRQAAAATVHPDMARSCNIAEHLRVNVAASGAGHRPRRALWKFYWQSNSF